MMVFPICLKLQGRRCLVVGGGKVALRKMASLVEAGAAVAAVSPEFHEATARYALDHGVETVCRPFAPRDVSGAFLVIAATNRRDVNEAVLAAAHDAGALVNVVDVPDLCDFYVPARVRRGDLQVAVTTGGACPALAKRLRRRLEEVFGPEYETFMVMCARLREAAQSHLDSEEARKEVLEQFLDGPALDRIAEGRTDEAERLLADSLSRVRAGR